MKKYIKWFNVLLLVVSITLLSSCKKVVVSGEYDIHSDLQASYMSDKYDYMHLYSKGEEELSYSKGITITWDDSIIDEADSYTFTLSLSRWFKDSKEYIVEEESITLYNLFIASTYYYKISNGTSESETLSFNVTTSDIRNLYIDGITNCRDVGGFEIGKKRANQGLIYRTSRLSNNYSTESMLSEEAKNIFLNDLGIKSEIDLREVDNNENGNITISPLGESVNYYSIPMSAKGNIMIYNQEKIKEVFEILGDENNYPLLFHCSIGTDRTGCIAFLIEALLGADEEHLYRDYLFSNFGNIGSMRTTGAIDDYLTWIDRLSTGNSLKEKVYNYLLNVGVQKKSLDNLIKIMTK